MNKVGFSTTWVSFTVIALLFTFALSSARQKHVFPDHNPNSERRSRCSYKDTKNINSWDFKFLFHTEPYLGYSYLWPSLWAGFLSNSEVMALFPALPLFNLSKKSSIRTLCGKFCYQLIAVWLWTSDSHWFMERS